MAGLDKGRAWSTQRETQGAIVAKRLGEADLETTKTKLAAIVARAEARIRDDA